MALSTEKPVRQHICECGKFMPEGQRFCFDCFLDMPATILYKLLDSDSGRRSIGAIDAEEWIRRRCQKPQLATVSDMGLDGKTAAAGGL